jgi:ADP-ribose pyrophosphatase YjhB (NUDIX family)
MPRRKSEPVFRNPAPTVDLIIEIRTAKGESGIVLIKRNNPPYGWALPGGFVDYGESLESAAVREAREETSLDVKLLRQLHTYSDPGRDPRKHTITTVFIARGRGKPEARDDAAEIGIFARREIDFPLAFDHRKIIDDYYRSIHQRRRTRSGPGNLGGGGHARPRS